MSNPKIRQGKPINPIRIKRPPTVLKQKIWAKESYSCWEDTIRPARNNHIYNSNSILAQMLRGELAAIPINRDIIVNKVKTGEYPWTFNQL